MAIDDETKKDFKALFTEAMTEYTAAQEEENAKNPPKPPEDPAPPKTPTFAERLLGGPRKAP